MPPTKTWQLAWKDYQAKMPYKEIAAKWEVSLSCVQQWQKRYWRKMDIKDVQVVDDVDDVHVNVQKNVHSRQERKAKYGKVSAALINNKNALGNHTSRNGAYDSVYAELAFNYCLLGAKDADLANFFHVSEQTINEWKKKYPEFLEALDRGKHLANARVARSLYEKCFDRVQQEEKAFISKGEPIIVPVKKVVEADMGAIKMFLSNRDPNWRNNGLGDEEGALHIIVAPPNAANSWLSNGWHPTGKIKELNSPDDVDKE